ncbi:MAG: SDR family NAD(P)-dependent oxidoreductase [Planctomycetota bacterium]|jgi:NAD(P)-dependent dehydrogenase (short-subunit alcohol dehydrogenase family)
MASEPEAAGGGTFAGKVVIVTGGSGGIGKASAVRFARAGATVVVADVNEAGGRETVAEISAAGTRAVFLRCDVSLAADCERVVSETVKQFDRLDVLFNNAGITRRASVVDTTEEEWDRVMAVNVKSMFLMSKYAVPVLVDAGGGAIVNTASGWGLVGGRNAVSYCASKGAVVLLTKAMACDHGPQNIRVNCICPGDTDTGMLRDEAQQLGLSEDALVKDGVNRPLGRVGNPDEIADAVLYLAGDASSFVTGTALVVDGGGLAGSM